MDEIKPKGLEWIGTSRKDMQALPFSVRRTFGYALYEAQLGKKLQDAIPLKGFGGAGVLEVIKDYRGNTYRAVYTIRFAAQSMCCIYFRKRQSALLERRQKELDLIRKRLKRAENLYIGKDKGV
ncbi:MAG: type II toxin-antitoxin system RelE/ParE family toxin [Proteobacteria bacterium]|nr:type II toxin-antitoxin system RelE/ParE family toxin [Pseudomonadota bacterium]